MSSWELGSVRSEIDGEYTDLIVGTGRGWGGDGKNFHRVYLEYWDKNEELHMMHLTTPQLEELIKILIPAYFEAQAQDEEEQGEDDEEEEDMVDDRAKDAIAVANSVIMKPEPTCRDCEHRELCEKHPQNPCLKEEDEDD